MLINLKIITYPNLFIKKSNCFKIDNFYCRYNIEDELLFYNNFTPNWARANNIKEQEIIEILISDKILDMFKSNDNYQEIIAIKLIENKAKIKLI